ncbi:MAG: DivIVA domain-containing protein [bacterium]
MKLTPLDIKKQEFKKSMRGYDPIEVDAFLEMVADELESLIREKNHLTDENLKLKTQLQDYQNVESTLKETLMQAQESVNESKATSKRQADMTVREAELKAEKILEDAKLKLADMKNELVLIRAQKDSFARRLRHLLESQLELIGVLELDDLGFEKTAGRSAKTKVAQSTPAETRDDSFKVKYEQEKIEFEGVEDIYPEEPASDNRGVRTVENATEKPLGDLPERPADDAGKDRPGTPDEGEERRSRISDQLIF